MDAGGEFNVGIVVMGGRGDIALVGKVEAIVFEVISTTGELILFVVVVVADVKVAHVDELIVDVIGFGSTFAATAATTAFAVAIAAAFVWLLLLLFVLAFDSLSKNDCNNSGLSITSNRQRFWSIIHNQKPLMNKKPFKKMNKIRSLKWLQVTVQSWTL